MKNLTLTINALLALAWFFFAYRHLAYFLSVMYSFTMLLFALAESLQAIIFLTRSKAQETIGAPFPWIIAIACTVLGLLFRPASVILWEGGYVLVIIGTVLLIFALLSLNRSFGVVPARRAIKTKGLYSWVRHPIYASYYILYTGYVLTNASLINYAIHASIASLLFVRIVYEERYLMCDPEYVSFMKRIRWRLVPFLY